MTAILQMALLFSLVARRNASSYPAFSAYIFMTLAQSGLLFVVIGGWGFSSLASWGVGWASQFLVLGSRALAVAELCRHILGPFRGVWCLARRIFLAAGIIVLFYALAAAAHQWRLALTTTEMGLELGTATVIVLLLLFARYYDIVVAPPLRMLALGLCLYSCFSVVNDTILERWLNRYAAIWNTCGMAAFLGCLLLWSRAFHKTVPQAAVQPVLLDRGVYLKIIPEVNWRLRSLDQQLIQFWRLEAPRA
ncbi:MAG TPA: hypothetical protein VKQ28_13445 [Candidatus Acidoferrum sp.]|nr:hypothetical protein [Candidatus Acidoferrum sp.]